MKYFYRAKRMSGEEVSGDVVASHIKGVLAFLSNKNLVGIVIEPLETQRIAKEFCDEVIKKPIPIGMLSSFIQQLADLTTASVPLLQSIKIIRNQTSQNSLRQALTIIASSLEEGKSFSDSLSQCGDAFNPILISMIQSSQKIGRLQQVLSQIAVQLEKKKNLQNKIMTSLAYPCLVFILGVLTVIVLMSFVVPRIIGMFEGFNATLPLPTILLIKLSEMFSRYGLITSMMIVSLSVLLKNIFKISSWSHFFIEILRKLPGISTYLQAIEKARFFRTFCSLVENDAELLLSFQQATSVVKISSMKEGLCGAEKTLMNGGTLAESLKKTGLMDEATISMLAVGEQTSRLDHALRLIANKYEGLIDKYSKWSASVISPLMLIVVVVFVGFVVFSMLLPIMEMNMLIE